MSVCNICESHTETPYINYKHNLVLCGLCRCKYSHKLDYVSDHVFSTLYDYYRTIETNKTEEKNKISVCNICQGRTKSPHINYEHALILCSFCRCKYSDKLSCVSGYEFFTLYNHYKTIETNKTEEKNEKNVTECKLTNTEQAKLTEQNEDDDWVDLGITTTD